MTWRAFRRPPPVITAWPAGQRPCWPTTVLHSSRICGPPARWIAPSTPPPPRSDGLAALTIASTSWRVMSPWTRTSLVLPRIRSMTGPKAAGRAPGRLPGRSDRLLPSDQRAALLAHELGDVVGSTARLAGRSAPLPAAERVDSGPRPGGGSGTAVDVHHSRLDAIEEPPDLPVVAAEQTGGETVLGAIGEIERLVQGVDLPQTGDRQEHLVVRETVVLGQARDDRGLHEETVVVGLALELLAARQDPPVFSSDVDESRVTVERRL